MDNSTLFDWIWHPGFLICNLPLLALLRFALFRSWKDFDTAILTFLVTTPIASGTDEDRASRPKLIVFIVAGLLLLIVEYQFLLRTCPQLLGDGLR